MMSNSSRFFARALCGALLLAQIGCGGDDAAPAADNGQDGGSGEQMPADDAGASSPSDSNSVPCNADYPTFTSGMSVSVGDLTVRLLSIDPNPPLQMVDNNWTLEVVDAAGMPVSGFEITNPNSWMVVHSHGGRHNPTVEMSSDPGQFKLKSIDFRMPGPWQVRFSVRKDASAPLQQATIQICVE